MEKDAEFMGETKLVAGTSEIMLLMRSLMFESILLGSLPLLMPIFLSGVLGSFDSASTISNELEVDFAFCEIYLSCVVKYEAFLRFSFELFIDDIILCGVFAMFHIVCSGWARAAPALALWCHAV